MNLHVHAESTLSVLFILSHRMLLNHLCRCLNCATNLRRAVCSRYCVIQTRIRLLTPKLPACSARTSESTTAKCGRLWIRAGRQTDVLHRAACHSAPLVVPIPKCMCLCNWIDEFSCDCCSPVWAAVLPILVGPVETVPISIFTYAGSGIQAQLF